MEKSRQKYLKIMKNVEKIEKKNIKYDENHQKC